MKPLDYILHHRTEVLEFLKQHYPMYHLSNVFFRDIQYGIRTWLERRGEKMSYMEAEEIARAFVQTLEKEKVLTPIDRQSWVLNYPPFKKPAVAPAAPAKPAPGAAPAKSPAAARARTPLPPLSSAKPAAAAQTSARPAGGLPPLTSAMPAGGANAAAAASAKPTDGQASGEQSEGVTQLSAQAEPATPSASVAQKQPSPVPAPTQQPTTQTPAAPNLKKSLPPLKGNYTPAGKKEEKT